MKKLLCLSLVVLLDVVLMACLAEPYTHAPITVTSPTTNAAVTTSPLDGYLDAIYIKFTGKAGTNVITIASARETLLTLTALTASGNYRPRVQAHLTTGVKIGTGTNQFERVLLYQEPLTITAGRYASASTNTLTIRFILDK